MLCPAAGTPLSHPFVLPGVPGEAAANLGGRNPRPAAGKPLPAPAAVPAQGADEEHRGPGDPPEGRGMARLGRQVRPRRAASLPCRRAAPVRGSPSLAQPLRPPAGLCGGERAAEVRGARSGPTSGGSRGRRGSQSPRPGSTLCQPASPRDSGGLSRARRFTRGCQCHALLPRCSPGSPSCPQTPAVTSQLAHPAEPPAVHVTSSPRSGVPAPPVSPPATLRGFGSLT